MIGKTKDKLLNVAERGEVETLRNKVLQLLEVKSQSLPLFEESDFDPSSPEDGEAKPVDPEEPQHPNNEKVMKAVIAIKHIIELIVTVVIFLFYVVNCRCRFIRLKYVQVYIFVIYFLLLVQDFILLAPPIWIFVYHVALLMVIFVFALRKKDNPNQATAS